MKYLNKILLAAIVAVAFTSCETDDFDPVEATSFDPEQVEISFTDSNTSIMALEAGGTANYEISLSSPLPLEASVTFTITSSDGSLESNGVQEVSYSEVKFAAGETSKELVLTFADDAKDDAREIYTVAVENLTFTETQNSNFILLTNDVENQSRTVNVYDELQTVVTTAGDAEITLSWRDAATDFDFGMFNSAGSNLDFGSAFNTTPETLTLLDAELDDIFTFTIYVWSAGSSAIDYNLEFVSPTETVDFTGTLVNASGFYGTIEDTLEVLKTTNGSEVTYVIGKI